MNNLDGNIQGWAQVKSGLAIIYAGIRTTRLMSWLYKSWYSYVVTPLLVVKYITKIIWLGIKGLFKGKTMVDSLDDAEIEFNNYLKKSKRRKEE